MFRNKLSVDEWVLIPAAHAECSHFVLPLGGMSDL